MTDILHLSEHKPPYGVTCFCDRCGVELDCTTIYATEEETYDELPELEEKLLGTNEDMTRCTDEE